MAIAFVNAVGNGYNSGGGDLTIAGSVSSGADMLVAVVHQFDTNNLNAVTWNGTAMTLIGTIQKAGGNDWVSAYYLLAPSVGSFNLVVDRNDANRNQAAAGSYSGTLQSGQPDASKGNTGTGTSMSDNLSSVADNCWHFFASIEFNSVQTASAGVTERSKNTANGTCYLWDSNAAKTPAGAFTQTVTMSPSSNYAYKQFTIAPVASGGNVVKSINGVAWASIKSRNGVATGN